MCGIAIEKLKYHSIYQILHQDVVFPLKIFKTKSSRRCKHCVLAVVGGVKKNLPHRRPLFGGAGRPKFNKLEMITTFTYKPSLVRIEARNFELSW